MIPTRLQTTLYWVAAVAASGMTVWMVAAIAIWLTRQF